MAYAILRTEKYKTNTALTNIMDHHLRAPGAVIDGVDPSRSHLNFTLGATSRRGFMAALKSRIETCTRKPRPDANKAVEVLMGASPEFFEGKTYEQQKAYLSDCLDFAKGYFGEVNVLGAYMHFDESTPHISVMCVPIETTVRKTKKKEHEVTALNASHYLGGASQMVQLQTDFALFVQARGHDLKRGEPKSETGRDHVSVAQHWKEKKKEIEAAGLACADLLNDAALESQAAALLFEHAAQEANRTGLGAEALMAQQAAFDTGQVALEQLRSAMGRQGAALDQEWGKLRTRASELEKREQSLTFDESRVWMKIQALEISTRTARDQVESTASTLASIREKEDRLRDSLTALQVRQWDVVKAEEVAELVQRPELLGMLDFLAKRRDARDLLALLKVDPSMAETVRQSIEVAVSMGSDLRAAEWGTAGHDDVEWQRVARAVEPVPLPDGFDWSSGGPSGP
jgi:hypothetical protein